MKTYKRKNALMAMAPIEGVLGLCRLCLLEVKHSVPIFSNKSDMCSSLATQIMMCVGYEVTQEDCLPNAICTECHKELTNYYEFRKKCNKTYHRLKAHLFAIQEKNAIEPNEKHEQQKTDSVDTISKPCVISDVSRSVCESASQSLSSLVSQSVTSSTDKLILAFDEITQIQFVHLDPVLDNGLDINIINGNTVPSLAVLSKGVEDRPKVPQTQPPDVTLCPDVTEFLSSILAEMGIVRKLPEGSQVTQECTSVQIETGDGEHITLELLQIDDEDKQTGMKKKIRKAIEKLKNDGTKLQNDERPTCSVCARQFASRAVLARHARVHTGERPFRCAQCGRRFAQREVLRRHELVHREVRPFACAWCPKSFTQRSALATHARRHEAAGAPRTLHHCASCPKAFLHASGLSRHMMSHQGRVFVCHMCPRRFTDDSSLRRHLRAKHKGAPPPAYGHALQEI